MKTQKNKEEIVKLRRKKDSIQMMVYQYVKMNQNASHLLPEYYNIVKQINELGGNVIIRSDYMRPEYWGTTLEKISKSSNQYMQNNSQEPIIEVNNSNNTYIIKLVWNNVIEENITNHLRVLLNKFCKYIDTEINEFPECVENILKYEYEGNDSDFKLLKSYLNTTIDILNDNGKYSIELFGKKMIK